MNRPITLTKISIARASTSYSFSSITYIMQFTPHRQRRLKIRKYWFLGNFFVKLNIVFTFRVGVNGDVEKFERIVGIKMIYVKLNTLYGFISVPH